jgi:hypothetical protein
MSDASQGVAEVLVESPFVDGAQAKYFAREVGWLIANNGDVVTLTCTEPEDGQWFSADWHRARALSRQYPAVSSFINASASPEGAMSFTFPTLTTANSFAEATFGDMPVAGLRAVQVEDKGNSGSSAYRSHLMRREMPVAYGHERYLHDILGHWLGAIMTDDQSFAVFTELCADTRQVYRHGTWPGKRYVDGVADGFDKFTEVVLSRTIDYGVSDSYLLGHTLTWIRLNSPDNFERACAIVDGHGMGVKVGPGRLSDCSVEWEQETLPAHYQQAVSRLQRLPYESAAYDLAMPVST